MHVELDLGLHPKQLEAFNTGATELLYGGATEGGKSHFLRVALISWCLQIPGLQCVLIRKRYADIINNHVEGPTGFRALLKPLIDLKLVTITQAEITFPEGSRIYFQHCQDERQLTSAQGVETHVLAFDESTQLPERIIKFFRGWCRMSKEFKQTIPEDIRDNFPRIIYTANPIGPSVPYFRRNFVKARPERFIQGVDGFRRQYILSTARDNLSVDLSAHTGRLAGMGDAALARALDIGDWDTPIGEFFPEWDERRHVIKDLLLPSHYARFRVFDWGTAEPFYVAWIGVSDGEPFRDHEQKQRWFPRGALIVYNEWYGCDDDDPAKGNRMRNEDIASGILQRSELSAEKVITLTDSLPFQDRGGETIAQTFSKHGVNLLLGDTSRVSGWSQMRSRLIGTQIDSNDPLRTPMIYVTESCKYARDYIPTLPRHPSESKREDAAEHGESTHACDAIRLACMAHPIIRDRTELNDEKIQRLLKQMRPTLRNTLGTKTNDYFGPQ